MSVAQEPAQESSVINKKIVLLHWRRVAFTWHQIGLGAILLLSAFLNLFRLDQNGFTNEFYAAAVRSMLVNWHNFFFNSFDPGGFITIDKPPVAFWFQALSAGIFGFNGVTILLPSAAAGVASVGLLYLTVKRVFGPTAGLLSALSLAVTPIMVVMSRHNNPEAILVLSLVIAAWALTHATEKGKLAWLLLAVGMVGVGFNVKMLEAFVVLPAFYLVYFLLAPVGWWKRIWQLALATVVLVAVSLSWAFIVDLTPADQRPYIGGSSDNTVLNLALNYNGLDRIEGNSFGGGGRGGTQQSGGILGTLGNLFNGIQIPFFGNQTQTNTGPGGFGGGGGGGVIAGRPGLIRMFERDLAGEAAWLLPMALMAILIIGIQSWKRFPPGPERKQRYRGIVMWGGWLITFMLVFSTASGIFHSYYLVMLAPAIAALFGAGAEALWHAYRQGGWRRWQLPVVLLISALFQFNILSVYTDWNRSVALVMVALELASACALLAVPRLVHPEGFVWAAWLTGIGLVSLLIAPVSWTINVLFSPTFTNATLPTAVPVGGIGNVAGFGFAANRGPNGFMAVLQANWNGWLSSLLIGLVILAALTVALRFLINRLKGLKPLEKISTLGTVSIVIVLGISMAQTALPPVAAASGSRTTTVRPPSTGVIGNPDMMFSNNDKLIAYLNANRDGSTYLLATTSSQNASPIIIKTGQPVMALGGFMGSDKVLTVQELEQDVKDNTIRFFLLDGGRGGFGGGGNQQLFSWIERTCKAVDTQLWSGNAAATGNNQGQANQSGTGQGVQPGTGGTGTQPGFGGNTRGNGTGAQSGANNGTGRGTLPGTGTGGTTRGGIPGFGNGTGVQPGFDGNGTGVQPGNGTTGRGVQPGFGGNGTGNQAGGNNRVAPIPPQQAFGGGRGGTQGSLYDCRGV